MDLTLAEIAGDEALREIAAIGSAAAGLTYGTYRGVRNMIGVRGLSSPPRLRGRAATRSRSRDRSTSSVRRRNSLPVSVATQTKSTRYRHNLGVRVGSYGVGKSRHSTSGNNARDKVIHKEALIRVPYNSDDSRMDSRNGALVNVRGVRIRHWFKLKPAHVETSGTYDEPLSIRWAILNPKENSGDATTDITGTDFFISAAPVTDPPTDFGTVGNSFHYMNRRINTEKYGVVKQGKFILHQDSGSTNTRASLGAQKVLNMYIPVKKQMKWASNGTTAPDAYPIANLYFVWWYCKLGDLADAQQFVSDQPMEYMAEYITHFKTAAPFK